MPARLLLTLALVSLSARVLAWSDHASLAWPLVRAIPELSQRQLTAEPLEFFIEAEAEGLAVLLTEFEAWSVNNVDHYPPTPATLTFDASADSLTERFLAAIRVNPTLPYALYRPKTVDDPTALPAPLRWQDLSFLAVGTSHLAVEYVELAHGDQVTAAQVLAAGSDEPDFGMDIGLFEDNDTEFGRRYGFGSQPFGNPNLDYGSQAPFHMGFYHLDWLTRTAQPGLLRTLPLWRIALYDRLASFAFERGHSYWGWRFMGWALHYIGDLTQPYHAVPLPGVSAPAALWLVLQGRTDDAVQLVSNRHGVLESFQYQRVQSAQEGGEWSGPLLATIVGESEVPDFSPDDVITVLTAESVAAAAQLDSALETYMPARFVSDPEFEWTGSGYESEVVDRVLAEGGAEAVSALDEAVMIQMARFSKVTRGWIRRALLADATPVLASSSKSP